LLRIKIDRELNVLHLISNTPQALNEALTIACSIHITSVATSMKI
jgi:hypothetical protein